MCNLHSESGGFLSFPHTLAGGSHPASAVCVREKKNIEGGERGDRDVFGCRTLHWALLNYGYNSYIHQ